MNPILKYALIAFLLSTIKTIPLAYCCRFYYRVLLNLVVPMSTYRKNGKKNTFGIDGQNKLRLFEHTLMKTYVSPMEIDPYFHKSNSTYFIDLDIARTDTVTKIFQKAFFDAYSNDSGEFKSKSLANFPYVPIATIQCVFKAELTLFQRYEIKSRVMAWDNKWLFVLSKFVVPKGNSEKLCAIAVTKYVFKKKGRITIRPIEMIKECGLYSEEVENINKKNYELVKYMSSSEDLEKLCEEF
ncbi:uncharacterized protein PRCAT00001053001 [Priceomyces carsonii]|uniref:uncharacterized protein n=1 Tax=Priceomyces carsonii TaxID=28549 RepID=UPI002ED923B5|nr:unnamed protein product [Priceomyces carsonii]